MGELTGRRAWVGGATQGIGRAIAEGLAARGAEVILVARSEEAIETLRATLPTPDGQAHRGASVDYGDWRAVRDAAEAEVAAAGPVHVLVHNTGGPPGGPAHAADPEAYERAFAQHVLSGQAILQAVLPGMREAGFGRIVNVISTSVITPIKGLGVSNTIRGATANWGRTLAHELAADGITVNNLLPGFTDTARLRSLFDAKAERLGTTPEAVAEAARATVPAGRFGDVEELAAVACFLASPAASYLTGVNVPVDGGRLSGQ